MELKGRLGAIASKIPECRVLADVGTDHAYIPIFAALKGLCERALATDIRQGPVKIAERNIRKYGLADRIGARLGPGLEPVSQGEADVAVIAGMGGPMIAQILDDSEEKARSMKLLILQPMNLSEVLREWLDAQGFEISEESLNAEGDKLYNIICVRWTGKATGRDKYEYYIGRELLESGDPLLEAYLEKKLRTLDVAIEGRSRSSAGREGLEEKKEIRDRLAEDLGRVRNGRPS